MQSAPPEVSYQATSEDNAHETSYSSQYGLPSNFEAAHDSRASEHAVAEPPTPHEPDDDASATSAGIDRGRRVKCRRMSSRESSSLESSPGSRIEAYEKAHAVTRKPSDGMIFQVVPSATGKKDNVSILEFPNEVLTHVLSHLPPESLSLMSLINRRFHKLVTTPPAWRIAFARFFPGAESTGLGPAHQLSDTDDIRRSHRRSFTRVSALASWRSEYILRTRLLRSLGRGRPAIQASTAAGSSRHKNPITAVVTYSSGLQYPISHIHATFGVGLNKRQPLYVHGAVEQGAVSASDPFAGKVSNWGLNDFEAFKHFADLFVGEAEYGLGRGECVGMPNVMDISQSYGKLYGEACPAGRLFYTGGSEQRGRFLRIGSAPHHEFGIPEVNLGGCPVTSVWLAKSDSVLKVTGGLFGCLAGFASGVLTAFAIGVNPVYDRRFEKGEPTAKWVLCPGVPIIAISVDEKVSTKRIAHRRVWATVLNALGEVFYLTEVPVRPEQKGKLPDNGTERAAWDTGRSVEWLLVESTRRIAKPDPFNAAVADGSYTPHTSSQSQGLSKDQLVSEAQEIERFLLKRPRDFQAVCEGWDMQRKLAVDYAGDDHHGGGESIFIVDCGFQESTTAAIKRLTRRRTKLTVDYNLDPYPAIISATQKSSIFGTPSRQSSTISSPSPRSVPRSRTSSNDDALDTLYQTEWHLSNFTFGPFRGFQLSALATDDSDFATLAASEDPLLGMSGGSNASSPIASPLGPVSFASSAMEIPGHRARFIAVGTSTGMVYLWDMRATVSPAPDIINTVQPVRIIHTRSPQISSLAMTSLYLVHGGNDGLVQAWDPLASTADPIRTLNSRFSDRARRRIAQAEASHHGVGHNYYAAGAVVLDPDPTVLRGMVSLGTQLRFWSYSASGADAYKSRKRGQLRRRSDRGSNTAGSDQKFHHTGRGVLKDYIADEKLELEREKTTKRKETERLMNRYGTSLLGEGASEEEMLAYATMLSEESYASDQVKRESSPPTKVSKPSSSNEPMDADLEEAIRLSLLDNEVAMESPQTTNFAVPIRYAKSSKHSTPLKQESSRGPLGTASSAEDDDLNFALQLSLAEQESRNANEADFSISGKASTSGSDSSIKGKGKSRH